ncbi:hypothetical protein F5Y00DRAFT_43692 [Daldinia vernicosa]|uniref:uncharacterized protein n=1 Tax=Daldinia vernicosa TaxID=114800 RepID=UPI0020085EC6|nr:uncharacterized protein F5Y00DRAFT_43692 [Daldinia vernicosa]KAI0850210.1 hypothetical protein F5Y00DRAFT_43692 [Daldinia vernicosa]
MLLHGISLSGIFPRWLRCFVTCVCSCRTESCGPEHRRPLRDLGRLDTGFGGTTAKAMRLCMYEYKYIHTLPTQISIRSNLANVLARRRISPGGTLGCYIHRKPYYVPTNLQAGMHQSSCRLADEGKPCNPVERIPIGNPCLCPMLLLSIL